MFESIHPYVRDCVLVIGFTTMIRQFIVWSVDVPSADVNRRIRMRRRQSNRKSLWWANDISRN